MSSSVLVTYASRAGATAGVAEAIGKTLVEQGEQVDVVAMQDVKDLTPYRAVVIGSAIQGGAWLPEALQFVKANQIELAAVPVAMFTVCMTLAMKNKPDPKVITDWVAPVRKMLHPRSEGYFAGMLDLSKVPSFGDRLKFRLSVMAGVWSEGDHRDWDAIRRWASELSSLTRQLE